MSVIGRSASALALAFAVIAAAHAADQAPAARAQVGKPVQQAQLLLKQKKYAAALARLRDADAVPDKTPYENYIIAETRAAAMDESGDYPGAATALQAVLATNILPPPEVEKRLVILVQLEYQAKDYAKTVAFAERYYAAGGSDPGPRQLMAQSYYFEQDFAAAVKTIRDILRGDERAGKPPDEALLLALVGAEANLKDQPAYVDALERLVASHPKQQYWVDLCTAVRRAPGFAQRLTLDLDRIEIATGAMTDPGQYVEAAELALAAGFPGDAKAFLAQGSAAGVLGKGAGAARQTRLVDMADHQADDDMKGLAQQAKEAAAAATGTAWEKLGEAYASYGRADDAIAALQKSLAKGGLDHPEDAKLHLGMAYLRAGQKAKAKEILQPLAGAGVGDLAHLWLIEGGAG